MRTELLRSRVHSLGMVTAERMRDTVAEVFPQLEEVEGERPKRWRLPNGLSGIFREPLADELAALRGVAKRLEQEGNKDSEAFGSHEIGQLVLNTFLKPPAQGRAAAP
jgi:hypothetical protein